MDTPPPFNPPEKAYKNLAFLNSPDARHLRILAEFVEPQARFRRHKIRDTLVFFGSARMQAPEDAEAKLAAARAMPGDSPEREARLAEAERAQRLATYYAEAEDLAARLTEWSRTVHNGHRFIICSGGGPGIMEAANRGALRGGGPTVALNISLPMEQAPNRYQTPELAFEFHYFFVRKFWFVYLAKAIVVFPGGFGTLDETFELLTLIQTQKTAKQMPIVLYGSSFWRQLINFDLLKEWGVISPQDLDLFRFCDTVDEAYDYLVAELTRLYL